ncbi:MAG: hypothetical protein KF834_09015 [Burkholderiales bacterium]|nr:hypothetical protein [Burkholderiales bacterium]
MHAPYHRKIIARGPVAEVEHCADCEIIHLHLGAFTLRLKPAVLHELRDTLSRALENLPVGQADIHAGTAAHPDGARH